MKFLEVEPFEFGKDIKVKPTLTTELKMRLRALKFETDTDIKKAKDIISQCFGDKSEEVREFAEENLYPGDLRDIQIMLLNGPQKYLEVKQQVSEFTKENIQREYEKLAKEKDDD